VTLIEALERTKATILHKMKIASPGMREDLLKQYIQIRDKINNLTDEQKLQEVRIFGDGRKRKKKKKT
jgi:hypothetical protein